ncbi:hypothetical protein EMIT0P2_100219 [Pseudomonas sp. IT-P2]
MIKLSVREVHLIIPFMGFVLKRFAFVLLLVWVWLVFIGLMSLRG